MYVCIYIYVWAERRSRLLLLLLLAPSTRRLFTLLCRLPQRARLYRVAASLPRAEPVSLARFSRVDSVMIPAMEWARGNGTDSHSILFFLRESSISALSPARTEYVTVNGNWFFCAWEGEKGSCDVFEYMYTRCSMYVCVCSSSYLPLILGTEIEGESLITLLLCL